MDEYLAKLRKSSQNGDTRPSADVKSASQQDGDSAGAPASSSTANTDGPKKLPKGVVLGPDGKPCRSCTSFAAWAALSKKETSHDSSSAASTSPATSMTAATSTSSPSAPPPDCPPDVDTLGRHTWTLLHTLVATYPERPTLQQRDDVTGFLRLFGRLYPCWVCAGDFQAWMRRAPVDASSRSGLGLWMCRAHNEVNRKLGKTEFDCRRWEERWKDGWKDGRCDG